jgi:hypothetical protein
MTTSQPAPVVPTGPPNSPREASGDNRLHTGVIVTSLCLGAAVIISSILKTWLREPNAFDWFLVSLGVVLCALSLLKKVAVTPTGLEADMKLVRSQLESVVQMLPELRGSGGARRTSGAG